MLYCSFHLQYNMLWKLQYNMLYKVVYNILCRCPQGYMF